VSAPRGTSQGSPGGASYIKEASRHALASALRPVVDLLTAMRVRPDALTVTGWALALFSAWLFATGAIEWAGAVMLFGGLFDALDGAVARASNKMSQFGAFLDSTLDRVSEAAVFVGILVYYARVYEDGMPWGALVAGVAMTFSLLTSYTRARAEGLGFECRVGLLERAGRVLLLSVSAMLGFLLAGLAVVAAGALVTTIQRILHVYRAARTSGG
jgi:CDP-diacylglycerol---glycerol-3-phosphate 3-phosphatidyltransferase